MTTNQYPDRRPDVIICGLGPTGAVLANLLGQRNLSVLVIERETELYHAPRAVHFDDEIMRVFQAIGLSEAIQNTCEPFQKMELVFGDGPKSVVTLGVGSQDYRYGYNGAFWFHQPTLETILRNGLNRFPNVEVWTGTEVFDLAQTETGESVTVSARNRAGEVRTARGKYVVGCDGGKSLVRKVADLPLDSADFNEPWVVIDVETKTGQKDPTLPGTHRQYCNPAQPVTYVPLMKGYYRWEFMVMDGKDERQATDPAHVREKLKPFVDLDTMNVVRTAHYVFHALWATRWYNGRLILAGDAAHQMPPFAGQGMCSGLRDASALAWRLNLMLTGKADASLLETYQSERFKHVVHITKGAMLLGNVIQTRKKMTATLRNWLLFRPLVASARFRGLFMAAANRKRPLETGIIGTNRPKIVGTLMIQPRVNTTSESNVLLQNVLGYDFSVLARRGIIEANRQQFTPLATLGCSLVSFDKAAGGQTIGDPEGKLHRWFDEHKLDFVIIRPDQYIFDGEEVGQISAVVRALTAHIKTGPLQPVLS
jgi:3-(3-hydroxy-phenyl)propionate hydroxylase